MQGKVSVDTWNFTMVLALVANLECMCIGNMPLQSSRAVAKMYYTKKGAHQSKQGEPLKEKVELKMGKNRRSSVKDNISVAHKTSDLPSVILQQQV